MQTHLLEVGTSSEDLMHKIFDGEDVIFARRLLNNLVVRQRNALFVDLSIPALVDQLPHGFQVGLAGDAFLRSGGIK